MPLTKTKPVTRFPSWCLVEIKNILRRAYHECMENGEKVSECIVMFPSLGVELTPTKQQLEARRFQTFLRSCTRDSNYPDREFLLMFQYRIVHKNYPLNTFAVFFKPKPKGKQNAAEILSNL